MTINVEIVSRVRPEEREYPCLLINDHGNVAYATSKRAGVIIQSPTESGWKVGKTFSENSEEWSPKVWKLFDGKITLSNK